MKKKPANVSVKLRQCNGNVEKMIRRFIKKTKKEGIIEQVRDRRYYKKPSEKRREEIEKAKGRSNIGDGEISRPNIDPSSNFYFNK